MQKITFHKVHKESNKKSLLIFFSLLFLSGIFAQDTKKIPLQGFVDMHTHPRGDLAFGTELFFGAPYGNISEALGNCKSHHSKKLIRSVLSAQTEQLNNASWRDGKTGFPDFSTWPSWCSILHQQMWVDWIKRAHQGGLNIIVALAVSSHTIAYAAKTKGPYDDEQVLINYIQGIKELVSNSDFMEVALSPEDVRNIVTKGKLAVIIGSEMDNIGNFYSPADHYNSIFTPNPSNEQIQAELDKLWELGLRYIFPVHLNNTVFGGSALIMSTLNVANKFVSGSEFLPEEIKTSESGISFRLQNPKANLNFVAKIFMPFLLPKKINPAKKGNYHCIDSIPGFGQRNSLGITEKGKFAINYMFHKGFLIDIDHMSEKMANEVLEMAIANDYPVNSGHNGLRENRGSEVSRTMKQYNQIKSIGGMVGMGHGENAESFVRSYRTVLKIMRNENVAIGTDVNGFYPLPRPNEKIKINYDSTFTRCTTGNRTWDINKDGVAHYGLLPDYIKSWEVAGMTPEEKNAFLNSAEHFTLMWEKCERMKNKIEP